MSNRAEFRVGANVILIRDGSVLLGLRKNVFGDGTWGLPGGHLEIGEELAEAAKRELLEETGIVAREMKFENVVNDRRKDKRHHIQIAFSCADFEGEVKLVEPDKCSEWKWFPLNALPENLFIAHINHLSAFKEKILYSEQME